MVGLMNYFLIVYNRRSGQSAVREFGPDEREAALHERFRLEAARDDRDIEVVVVGSPSLEVLRRTHGRYFNSVEKLAGVAAAELRDPSVA